MPAKSRRVGDHRESGCSRVPFVFISHDARDARIAKALSTLLKNVFATNIEVFCSSATRAGRGIPPGVGWFEFVCSQIDAASVMICLLTPHGMSNRWIFWEAGAAMGKGKRAYNLVVGLPMEEACKGPFFHLQNSIADKAGLIILLEDILDHLGLPRNQYGLGKAIDDFRSEIENILLETRPPIADASLGPHADLRNTLQEMNVNLFAIDGIAEVCRSIKYCGWGRADMALPQVIGGRALPHEFTDYPGNDVICEGGSQQRYSLRSINEPLHDAGRAKIRTTLAPSKYSELFRLARLLDKPFIPDEGRMVTGRCLYGHQWSQLEKSPVIHNVNMQPIVITQDEKVVLAKRSGVVHHYPGCWSVSMEEQMIAPGNREFPPDRTYFDCAERGVREELACTPNPEATRILSVGIEYTNLSASFLCIVYVFESFKEVCENWLKNAEDLAEASALDCLALNKESLQNALHETEHKPTSEVFRRTDASQARWHPTARMRLYALSCHLENETGSAVFLGG